MSGPADIAHLGGCDGAVGLVQPAGEAILKLVPPRRGVMLLCDEHSRGIILMTGANLRSRLRARLRDPDDPAGGRLPDLGAVTRQIFWWLTTDTFETDLAYLDLAAVLYPDTWARTVAWKPFWWVHVDLADRFPHFARMRGTAAATGRCFGPFATAKAAERFTTLLEDALELCRRPECGRHAPHGPPCTYAQMGKCLSVCDGTTALEAYAAHVAAAVDAAAGDDADVRRQLARQMESAAEQLQFERADAVKKRLARLDELRTGEFAHVRPMEDFRFIVFQRSGSRRAVKAFGVCGTSITAADRLTWPLLDEQLTDLLERIARHAQRPPPRDRLGDYRLALVSRLLLGDEDRKRLLLHVTDQTRVPDVRAAITAAADLLKIPPPAPET